MRYRLYKIFAFPDKYFLITYIVHKRVIVNVHQDILRNIIFMQTNDAIFTEVSILCSIAKSIAAMPAFRSSEIRMGIQVDYVDLRQG